MTEENVHDIMIEKQYIHNTIQTWVAHTTVLIRKSLYKTQIQNTDSQASPLAILTGTGPKGLYF